MLTITNEDNMCLMARYPDKYFDLAIVDPPYGINIGKHKMFGKGKYFVFTTYKRKNWDEKIPPKQYFLELERVSKKYMIFGGNYFTEFLKPTKSWLVRDKKNTGTFFSEFELIYCSFKCVPRIISIWRGGNCTGNPLLATPKIHPAQKPVKLYKKLLEWYSEPGYKILDTHLGSGSIAIACLDFNLDLTACELDKDYFDGATKRIKEYKRQLVLI